MKSNESLVPSELKQRRILIVDDEGFNQIGLLTVMKTLKRFKGIAALVDMADNGEQCIEKAR